MHNRYVSVAVGATKTDFDLGDVQTRIKQSHEILKACHTNTIREQVPIIYPVKHLTKQEIWNELPEELRELTWSCRTPKGLRACGTCKTCKQIGGLPE